MDADHGYFQGESGEWEKKVGMRVVLLHGLFLCVILCAHSVRCSVCPDALREYCTRASTDPQPFPDGDDSDD